MGLVVELFKFLGRHRYALGPDRHGVEFDPAQDWFAVFSFLEEADRRIRITFQREVLKGGKGEKCQHVTTRKGGYEGLLGVGDLLGAEVIGSGGCTEGYTMAKVEIVIARILLVAEALAVALPVESDLMGAHFR